MLVCITQWHSLSKPEGNYVGCDGSLLAVTACCGHRMEAMPWCLQLHIAVRRALDLFSHGASEHYSVRVVGPSLLHAFLYIYIYIYLPSSAGQMGGEEFGHEAIWPWGVLILLVWLVHQ